MVGEVRQSVGLGQVGVGMEDGFVGRGEFGTKEQASNSGGSGLGGRAADGIGCSRTGALDWRTGAGSGLWGFSHFKRSKASGNSNTGELKAAKKLHKLSGNKILANERLIGTSSILFVIVF